MLKLVREADIFSILNALFGFLAIFSVLQNEIRFAISFILLAVLSDGADGIVARKKKNGPLGEFLDPAADFTSFCIAPCLLVISQYYSIFTNYIDVILLGFLFVFIIFGLIRLTAFPSIKKDNFFVGLPAPAAGLVITLLTYLKVDIMWLILGIIFLSSAMISRIGFPKTNNKIGAVAAILIIFTVIMGSYYHNFFPILLLAALISYIIAGPLYIKKSMPS